METPTTTPRSVPRQAFRSAQPFLTSLLLKTIRVHTKDGRVFVGTFKCTDRDLNIILSETSEFRPPPVSAISEILESTPPPATRYRNPIRKNSIPSAEAYMNIVAMKKAERAASLSQDGRPKITITVKSRFIGLVCIPGREVTKVELEE
ncbi:hypothetical protein BJ508DRAFT_410738 [Ascobolus immersus RN42]|uniref:Sm domain-containing protein n=1 Tax=Ascobolus immersus RN42 TaxID=1160509 RepID=A0A3N4IR23_ASCIM|nr:hypothetical protein BJ508DRAFT_410738 [Ascobolus immersus RN42]